MAYIEFKNVCKNYQVGKNEKALKNANFEIEKGELIVITGPTGAGKTTCLNILGKMDDLTDGQVYVDETCISNLKGKKLVKYRRYNVGFIFEDEDLLKNLTVKENVELATQICKSKIDPVTLLKKVGLSKNVNSYPSQLTDSKRQSVLIARAIAKDPKLILCDELSDDFDQKTKKQVLKLLQNLALKEKKVVVIVNENGKISPIANKVITLKNGNITSVKINKKQTQAGDLKW